MLEEADIGHLLLLLVIIYQDIQIKGTEVAEACGIYGR